MAPDVIADRYRVLRAVGRGGMGTVWLCRDDRLGRDVAIKQVGLLPGEETADVARALREARTLAVLNHRNVVTVYDTIDQQDRFWLVMEYVPGRTLSEMIAQDGPVPAVRAAWIGAQVADGLAAAHARGIVHRDVKPGNVLVTDDDVAKVSDFGIARKSGDLQITKAGIISGTPAYFAPEVARGEDSGPAADVWALGATLYAAVEGRPPYEDRGNPLALLAAIAAGTRPHPAHAGILAEALNRMFDPDPRSRWTMDDAAHVLHRLHERHGPAPTRTITHHVERPVAAAAPAPAPAPLPAPLSSSSWTEPESTEPAEKRRGGVFLLGVLVSLLILAALVGAYLLLGSQDDDSPTSADTEVSQDSDPERRTSAAIPTAGAAREPAPESPPVEETPTITPSSSPTPRPTPSSAAPTPAPAGSAEQFASTYYGYLPSDTNAGWQSLSPSFQSSIGRGSYDGFWSTISAVEVTGSEEVEPGVVDVSLIYTKADGTTVGEVHRLYLEQAGDVYLIVDDDVVG